jgi:TolB-like protein/class 3 adenylate cyclase/Tfp pilus assembly protein PilF
MSAEVKKEIQLEIAHLLLIDLVGYSKLLVDDQIEVVQELNRVVRSTECFQAAEKNGKLIRVSTGDGMALLFSRSPEEPAQCALEISKALKNSPQIQVRMGVHSGPVSGVIDVNERANVAGTGINVAQRVMDCGDPGHILLSKHVAEDLEQYRQWQPYLHDLGECEVKHGVRITIVNLYTDEVGNSRLPKKFQAEKKHRARIRWAATTTTLLALAAIVAGIAIFSRSRMRSPLAAPEKSIAVLPFENSSEDKANAYFAEGIQDEILTRLSKIADLKVISRTSTQHYKSAPENLREIARQLGVAHILEGRVQKSGDAVRVNVQLIKAANDSHLWAESFDRKLTDIFDVESEIAKRIAGALQAELTGREEEALTVKPTHNPEAYDLYLRGLAYSLRPGWSEPNNLAAIKYFTEAVKLDPKFGLAWAWLARESALAYFNKIDVPALRETAKNAASKAIEFLPNRAEAYLAQGFVQYYCERDYDSAIASFEKAEQLSPNNSQVPEALGLVWRRKGQWQRSLKYFRQATELDPRNISLLSWQGDVLWAIRQYSVALKTYDQMLEISPDSQDALAEKAGIYQAQGNLSAAATLLSRLRPEPGTNAFYYQIQQWMYERRYNDAIAALKDVIGRNDRSFTSWLEAYYTCYLALLQQFSGDTAAAHVTWQQVQTKLEELRRSQGGNFTSYQDLASAYVGLGDKTKAFAIVKEGQSVALASKDELWAAGLAVAMARIAAQAGEKELALDQLVISAQKPGGVIYGDLKLNPLWDSLRGDPRFQDMVASLTPKN